MVANKLRTAVGLARLVGPYALLGVLKHAMTLDRLARWAWRPAATPARDRAREARVIADTIRLSHVLGVADRDCLQRSLLLYRELSRAGADPELVMGFRGREGHRDGHAWIVVDRQPVGETAGAIREFVPLCAFGSEGRRLPERVDSGPRA